ncbi:MAG TPA: STAS domain-containing protein [Solirubrobacteraceae bacterium]|jgi:anti-anti-sigma factor
MTAFTVERNPNGDAMRVVVSGELDMATGPRLEEELRRAQAGGHREVVLDLTGVTFFDSTGLQVVLDAEVRAREGGQELLIVVAADGEPLRVLRLAEVTDRLRISETGG